MIDTEKTERINISGVPIEVKAYLKRKSINISSLCRIAIMARYKVEKDKEAQT